MCFSYLFLDNTLTQKCSGSKQHYYLTDPMIQESG